MQLILEAYTLSECMELMSEYASAYEAQGMKNLIFCEDRLTLIAERALLRKVGATFSSSVTTFARFLQSDVKALTKQGSVMAVGDVMAQLSKKGQLNCFTSFGGSGNNAKSIYETLAQFSASEITPDTLQETLQLLPDDILKKKISDLSLIYEGYLRFLQEHGYADESTYLSLLPQFIENSAEIRESNVFFLCFSSFTAQAKKVIRAAAKTAKNVIGIFFSGEEEIYSKQATNSFLKALDGFKNTQTRRAGTPLDGVGEVLRKGLFDPEIKQGKMETDRLHIFEAGDKTAESEYVATQIKRVMAENEKMRYRDIAILLPDTNSYTLPLKKVLREYGIPFFLDEKKSLKRHPLSHFLLDCFRVARENFSPDSVQSLTQNFFFGESDTYRNYLLKFANYRGGAKREIKDGETVEALFPEREKLESGRARALEAAQFIKQKATGRSYCNEVRRILRAFDVENKLKDLENSIDEIAQKAYLSQIYGALERVLSEAEMLIGERELSISEYETILADGLEATEISLIPLKADAVFVGDITESRIEKVRVLFAMGMTDAVPATGSDSSIVSDKEIERLAEMKTLLEPTVAEVNLRKRESAGLNLCTFLDDLYLSYPMESDGGETLTSEVFRYIDRLFTQEGKPLQRKKQTDEKDYKYKCSAVAPAVRQLLIEKNEFEQKRKDTRITYSSLFSALDKLSVTEKDDYLKEKNDNTTITDGEKLFFTDGRISPTSIEGYFACPFRHFVERGLKLKERDESAVLAVDTGNFIHDLLCETMKDATDMRTEAEVRAYALEVGQELLKKSIYAIQQDTASGSFFTEKLLAEGADVVVAAYKQIVNSDFSVSALEEGIATEEIHGKIDRVDVTDKYVRVVDYKTGKIDDSATSYYTGRKVQMQLYMSAVQGERVPAGVFYFPASVAYTDKDEGRFRMSGFLNGTEEALKLGDKNLKEGIKSEYFDAALKNSATKKKIMDEQTFQNFIAYSTHVAKQGCKEMKEGNIAPSPYKGSCQYCKYGGMCGFDKDVFATRAEPEIDGKGIAKIVENMTQGEK